MDPRPGVLITPNVRLVRELGAGGMGSVWVADHLTLQTQVAVKLIHQKLWAGDDRTSLQRFRREARAAAKLKSAHVVRIFDHGVMSDGTPYIVMELLEGESLHDRLRQAGRLAPAEVCAVISQAAKALGEAHRLGVVHRDVKPHNLWLTQVDGELLVKLLDFGIAKPVGELRDGVTATGTIVGTPRYMSPEQLTDAKSVAAAADLWALGVTAYEALTGQAPFAAQTPVALWQAMAAETFTPPSELRPGLPAAVDAWFEKALRADPAQRFGSAAELAESLLSALLAPSDSLSSPQPGGVPSRTDSAAATADFVEQHALDLSPEPPPEARPERTEIAQAAGVPPAPVAAGAPRTIAQGPLPPPAAGPARARSRRITYLVPLGGAGLIFLVGLWAGGIFSRPEPPAVGPPASGVTAAASEPAPRSAPLVGRADTSGATSTSTADLPPAAPSPSAAGEQSWPLTCSTGDRPCGRTCCPTGRHCGPGRCDDPLDRTARFDLYLWQVFFKSRSVERLERPDLVRLHFGPDEELLLRPDQPATVTAEQLARGFSITIRQNERRELPPFEQLHHNAPTAVTRRLLCRGLQLAYRAPPERKHYYEAIWFLVVPHGEARPACN